MENFYKTTQEKFGPRWNKRIREVFLAVILSICPAVWSQNLSTDTVTSISLPFLEMDEKLTALSTYTLDKSFQPWAEAEKSLGNEAEFPALEMLMTRVINNQSTPEARNRACKILAIIGTDQTVPILGNLLRYGLRGGELRDVESACYALAALPYAECAEVLREELEKSQTASESARIQMINALGSRGDRESIPLLGQMALSTKNSPALAEAALRALGQMSGPEALDAVTGSLTENMNSGQEHLVEIGYEVILNQAVTIQRDTINYNAVIYEGIKNSKAVPAAIRRSALLGLIRSAGDRGVQYIRDILLGEDSSLKSAAIAAIAELPCGVSSSGFTQLMSRLTEKEQVLMIYVLASRADVFAVNEVIKALESERKELRAAAVKSAPSLPIGAKMIRSLISVMELYPSDADSVVRSLIRLPEDEMVDLYLKKLLDEYKTGQKGKKKEIMVEKLTLVLSERASAGADAPGSVSAESFSK